MKGSWNEAPERLIAEEIKSFILQSPANRLQETGGAIYEEPLVGFACGDDPLFQDYKRIIGTFYLTPQEVLKASGKLSVISWILPKAREIRAANRRQKKYPARAWSLGRWYGEALNDELKKRIVGLLQAQGFQAVAPTLTPAFQRPQLDSGPTSNWSERHTAYAAGLGTFSLSDGLITAKGIAMRCGSVVTDLALPPTPRPYAVHTANCLFYRDGSCNFCISRCPSGAITERGHDKKKCQQHLRDNIAALKEEYGVETVGCGLCQTGVPCEARIPVRGKLVPVAAGGTRA
ncbi:MAG: epoxyqueuosine reductase [Chloroflexota bacterium]|nr:epoxyqueuosine reductase [Chloroflexota bacterium]